MKSPFPALAFLCFLATAAPGQEFDPSFGKGPPYTAADLMKNIVVYPYTWEVTDGKTTVKFNADGTGRQAFFEFTWRPLDSQRVQITVSGGAKTAILRFNGNYTAFDGADFDGQRPIHGALILPQPAAAAPTPAPPAPVASGTPRDSIDAAVVTPPPRPLVPTPTPTPRASDSFFDHLQAPGGPGNDDIVKAVVNTRYTWEHQAASDPNTTAEDCETVLFLPNGEGRHTFFKITWRIRTPHEIEISRADDPAKRKAVLKFNSDFTKYTATDLNGESPLSGHKLAGPTPAPAPEQPPATVAPPGPAPKPDAPAPNQSSYFGDPAVTPPPRPALPAPTPASTPSDSAVYGSDDMVKAVTNTRYTLEHQASSDPKTTASDVDNVLFLPNGEGRLDNSVKITWHVKNTHEIEFVSVDDNEKQKAVLRFNPDFTKYTGFDFIAMGPLSGHKLPAADSQ